MARRGTRRMSVIVCVAAIGAVLAGCTTGGGSDNPPAQPSGSSVDHTVGSSSTPVPNDSSPSVPTSTSPSETPTPSAKVSVAPAVGSGQTISPTTPITVQVADGQLTKVKLTNDDGKAVKGQLGQDSKSWSSTEPLGYSRTYKLTAIAVGSDGLKATKKATYKTVSPPNMTMPSFQYTGGYSLKNGETYGVGIVPIVHWDEPITDKKAALAMLSVSTTPALKTGAWYWSDDQNVAYRPKAYWPAHTQVTITVKDYGKQVSPGLYGQADATISFKIGDKHVTQAYDSAPKVDKVKVFFNDKLVKTYNTSMGRHSGVTVKGNYISYYTMDGTYTVIAHENPARMNSASYGLPVNAPGGYDELIYWATKISTDGIYLHELNSTIWAQNNGNDVSHGCLNLPTAAAKWFYENSQIGDVVVVHGTKGAPKIDYWQGGAWSVPWSTWSAGGTS